MIVKNITYHKLHVKSSTENFCKKKRPCFLLNADRNVRFSDYSKPILPDIHFEDELRDRIWHGSSDVKLFKNKVKMDVFSFKNQVLRNKATLGAPETHLRCMRGLEQRFDAKRKMRRRMAIKAVLDVQKRYKSSTWSVKEFYKADISKKFSTTAKSQALLDGLADERNAKL